MIRRIQFVPYLDMALAQRAIPSISISELQKWVHAGNLLYADEHSLAMVEFPSLGRPPQVVHFHADCMSARRAMVAHVLHEMERLGYNTFRALNGSGHADHVWKRAFEREGWIAHPIKTVFDFEKGPTR